MKTKIPETEAAGHCRHVARLLQPFSAGGGEKMMTVQQIALEMGADVRLLGRNMACDGRERLCVPMVSVDGALVGLWGENTWEAAIDHVRDSLKLEGGRVGRARSLDNLVIELDAVERCRAALPALEEQAKLEQQVSAAQGRRAGMRL